MFDFFAHLVRELDARPGQVAETGGEKAGESAAVSAETVERRVERRVERV